MTQIVSAHLSRSVLGPLQRAYGALTSTARRRRALSLGVIATLGLLVFAYMFRSNTPPPEVVVGLKQYPPFMYRNANGEAEGAMPDLLNAAAARAGFRLRWVDSSGGPMADLKPGSRIDIWPVAEVHDERRALYHLTQPFARSEMLLVRLSRDTAKAIKTLALGSRPSVLAWARRQHAGASVQLRDPLERLKGLCSGSLDAAVVEAPALDSFLMHRPDSCGTAALSVVVLPGLAVDFAIASSFQAADTADLLRHELGRMARDNTFDAIFHRYYPLAHYRSSDTFAETETERASRLFRLCLIGLLALCGVLWLAMYRLRRKAKEAVATAEQRTRFLATISHELRTPLNGVLGIASALSATGLDPNQQEYVRLIRNSGEDLLGTVNRVLDLFRLEAGSQSLTYADVDLEAAVESVLSILAPVARQKGLELAWTVEDSIPKIIRSDETALRQILTNLLGNALKFTPRGMVTLRIDQQSLDRSTSMLRITVTDEGPGIPEGQEESIFVPFTRSGFPEAQAAPGSGLGLSITKQLVLLMGGVIHVENQKAGGCSFVVSLPLVASASAAPPKMRCHRNIRLPGHALVLTRHAVTGDMLARRLRESGCEVTRAADIRAAIIDAGRDARWDLLVLDDDMEGDAVQAAMELEQHPSAAGGRVVLLTAKQRLDSKLRYSRTGACVIFPKPFLSDPFWAALENFDLPLTANHPPAAVGEHPGDEASARIEIGAGAASATSLKDSAPPLLLDLQRRATPGMETCPGLSADEEQCEDCIRAWDGGPAPCIAHALRGATGARALVADDNPVNRKVITTLLEALNVPSDIARDGEEALALFSPGRYGWVIMDWYMPRMDGLTAIRHIRELDLASSKPLTPLILCSAVDGETGQHIERGRNFEFVLSKPISMDTLQRALVISLHRVRHCEPGRLEPPDSDDTQASRRTGAGELFDASYIPALTPQPRAALR